MPVAVEALGLSRRAAPIAVALLFAGSAIGGIIVGRIVDQRGVIMISILAFAAFPVVAVVGSLSGQVIFLASFLAGCFAFGVQTALHGVAGGIYPTQLRGNGVGWAVGIAKIGSIMGPILGGLLLGRVSNQVLFLAAAAPLLIVSFSSFALARHRVRSDE